MSHYETTRITMNFKSPGRKYATELFEWTTVSISNNLYISITSFFTAGKVPNVEGFLVT